MRFLAMLVALVCCSGSLRAAEYMFMPERYTSINFTTTEGKGGIKV